MALTRRTMYDLGPGGVSMPDYGAQERQQQRALEAQIMGMALEQSRYMFQASFNQRNKAWEQAMKEKAYEASRKDVEAEAAFKQEQLGLAQEQASQADAFRQEQRQWQQTNKESQEEYRKLQLQKLLQEDKELIPMPEHLGKEYAPHLEKGSLQTAGFIASLQTIAGKEEIAERGRSKEKRDRGNALREIGPGGFGEELEKFRETYPQEWTPGEKEEFKQKIKVHLMRFPDDAPFIEKEFENALNEKSLSTASLEGEQINWDTKWWDISPVPLSILRNPAQSIWETIKQVSRSDEERMAKDKERRDAMRESLREIFEEATQGSGE